MERNSSLDFLRASAILLVIGAHVSQNFSPLVKSSASFAGSFGAFGVQLFFIVSAYTLLLTFEKVIDHRVIFAFYVRRFFRIAPLFYIAGVFYILKGQSNYWAPNGISIQDVILTYTFLNWLTPNSFNSVIPGSWSIGIEVLFYAFFPVFAYAWISGKKYLAYASILVVYLLGIVLSKILTDYMYGTVPDNSRHLVDSFFFFWLPRQILAFGFGFILFQIVEERSTNTAPFLILSGAALSSFWGASVLTLFLFSYFILSMKIHFKSTSVIGRCSYSMYLLHFGVIDLLRVSTRYVGVNLPFEVAVIFVVAISLMVAEFVTKPLIEDKFIRLGRRLSNKISREKSLQNRKNGAS